MDQMLLSDMHGDHDPQWIVESANHKGSLCVACLVQLLENKDLLILKKKLVLSEFVRLMTHNSSEVFSLLSQREDIILHVVMILLELFEAKDETFLSLDIEACLKILHAVKSEELITLVLDKITKMVSDNFCEIKSCLPGIILIGRLLSSYQFLNIRLLQCYGQLVNHLGNALEEPDETIQSQVIYVFIFLMQENTCHLFSSKLKQKIAHSIISILDSSQSVGLQLNTIGLLRTVIKNKELAHITMRLKLNGTTLGSAFKMLLLSKKESLQTSAAQCIAELLTRWKDMSYEVILMELDVSEFLFEALSTRNGEQIRAIFQCITLFADCDQFFTQFHSVYGIESLIRTMEVVFDLRMPQTMLEGLLLLAKILEKQPESISLFSSNATVHCCLSLIGKISSSHHVQVIEAAIKVFAHIIRFVMECQNDPTTCESNFQAPSTKNDGMTSTPLKDFCLILLRITDEFCIPVVMLTNNIVSNDLNDLQKHFFSLMCHLFEINNEEMSALSVKLVATGFLTSILGMTYSFKLTNSIGTRNNQLAAKIIEELFKHHHSTSPPARILDGIQYFKYPIRDIPQALMLNGDSEDTQLFVIDVLYFSYIHGHEFIPKEHLLEIVGCFLQCHPMLKVLPSHSIQHLVFLVAWLTVYGKLSLKSYSPEVFQSILQFVGEVSAEQWYTHHSVLLEWCFTDPVLAAHVGGKLMESWLCHVTISDLHPQSKTNEDGANLDTHLIPNSLMHSQHFGEILLTILATFSEDYVRKSEIILQQMLHENSNPQNSEFCLWCKNKATELLQNLFLIESIPKEYKLCSLLSVLTSVKSCGDMLADSKLLYHVINCFGRDLLTPSTENLLKYISAYVSNSSPKNKILSVLTQSKKFLKKLERCLNHLHPEIEQHSQFLLGQMIQYTSRDIKAVYKIPVCLTKLTSQLISPVYHKRLCSIQMFSALFHSRMGANIVSLQTNSILQLSVADKILCVDPADICRIYIYLQQCIIQDLSEIREAAVVCILKILDYLKESDSELEIHILHQPWNHLMCQILLEAYKITTFPAVLFQYFQKILESKGGLDFFKPHVACLLNNLLVCLGENLHGVHQLNEFVIRLLQSEEFEINAVLASEIRSKLQYKQRESPKSISLSLESHEE